MNFKVGSIVGNSKWTGKVIHQSPHTITVETIDFEGKIKIYRRKRKQLKILKYFDEFKIGDRCYVFDCYHPISNYDCVLFPGNYSLLPGNYSLKEAIVTDTSNYIISIKLLNNDNSQRYKQVYKTENEIKTFLIHRNKFLKDLDVGRYGRIKIDQILDDSNIKITNIYDTTGYTFKSWILSLDKINGIICCLTHYDCDIENCKYKSINEKYLITFSKLDEFEYCDYNECIEDSVKNRERYAKTCSYIYTKYIKKNFIEPIAFIIKVVK